LESVNFEDLDSVRYFQKVMKEKGVVDKLKELALRKMILYSYVAMNLNTSHK